MQKYQYTHYKNLIFIKINRYKLLYEHEDCGGDEKLELVRNKILQNTYKYI